MVRFKNRHLLVEFLQPSSLLPAFGPSPSVPPQLDEKVDGDGNGSDHGDGGDGEDDEDDEMLHRQPELPFLVPLPDMDHAQARLKFGDEGGATIYRAVRGVVQEVFGDEGWGRIAPSFKGKSRPVPPLHPHCTHCHDVFGVFSLLVSWSLESHCLWYSSDFGSIVIYHSPLTTLTIIRVARPHYRLVWSSITLLTRFSNQPVLPRVVAVSGTIKKLQNAAIVYHRAVTARALAVALDQAGVWDR